MTELEKMRHAKNYIDMLANGMNPLSGEEVPEDSTLNNVRLSRCFFYVSDILRQVIDNGGEVGRKASSKPTLLPFSITDEQASQIEISEAPVGVSIISKRIAEVLPEDVKPLSAVQISSWLLEQGFLTENIYSGKKNKVATQKGISLGISTVEGSNAQGVPYKKNIYNLNAQRYIIENLNRISSDVESPKGE